MTITERKAREKQEMKELILEAAKQLFIEEGFANVSIRRIAEKIEYSPATIYLYFKDKDEILYAVHQQGFETMMGMFRETSEIQDPFQRLRALCITYLRFAMQHREFYDLMFIMRQPMNKLEAEDAEWNCGNEAFNFLNETVQECVEQGYLPAEHRDIAAYALWAYSHGIAALIIRGRCRMIPQDQIESTVFECGIMLNKLIEAHFQANKA